MRCKRPVVTIQTSGQVPSLTSFASKERERARKALDSRMQRVPVESSSIASIGYAPKERVLELEFRQSGEVYQYFDVPSEEYTAFLAADSKGTYVNQQLKPRGYRSQRLPSSSK